MDHLKFVQEYGLENYDPNAINLNTYSQANQYQISQFEVSQFLGIFPPNTYLQDAQYQGAQSQEPQYQGTNNTDFDNQPVNTHLFTDTANNLGLTPYPAHQPPVALAAQTQHSQAHGGNQIQTFAITIHPGNGRKQYTVQLSIPAQVSDLGLIHLADRPCVAKAIGPQAVYKDPRVRTWVDQILTIYWECVAARFTNSIPASLRQEVQASLARGRPFINDPWTGHTLYKAVLGRSGAVQALEIWMYGSSNNNQLLAQTWRETRRLKNPASAEAKRVPYVRREVLLAVWILLKMGDPASDLLNMNSSSKNTNNTIEKKWMLLRKCKLDYLISSEDPVTPDPYWAGFEQEIETITKTEAILR